MFYNKAKAEREWLKWKEEDMKMQRAAGMSEEQIQAIYDFDKKQFNSDRRYYEHTTEDDEALEWIPETDELRYVDTPSELLAEIENEELYAALSALDTLTVQILIWKMNGYSSEDISQKCGLSINAINFRVWHFRKKNKKIFKDI